MRSRGWGRVTAMVLTVSLSALALTGMSRGQDPDLSWPPNFGFAPDKVGFVIQDSWVEASRIAVAVGNAPACSSIRDPKCAPLGAKHGWWILRVAPPCGLALPWEECVESLALVGAEGTTHLSYTGQAPGLTFPSDPERGLPTGSTMSLFDDPETESSDDGYAVYLGGQMIGKKGPFRLGELSVQVFRYRLVPHAQNTTSGMCLWGTPTHCAQRRAFPEDRALKAAVRLHTSVTGWLGGRLEDPAIRVTPVPGVALNRVEVMAKPVELPLVAVSIPKSEATQEIRDYWADIQDRCGDVPCPMQVTWLESWSPRVSDVLRVYAPFLGDTATRVIPTWSVVPLTNAFRDPCLKSKEQLLGLVTTNATVFNARQPEFSGGSLRYQVAALHHLPGGEVFRGSYDLVMRSETARCLYGFTNAPIRADITVTSEDGVDQAVSTSLSESGGWLRLSARNFHFSRPTIQVTLKSTSRDRVLVCTKGEKTKKVTSVNPSCPKGWRPVRP
jgi:hypothetical protein